MEEKIMKRQELRIPEGIYDSVAILSEYWGTSIAETYRHVLLSGLAVSFESVNKKLVAEKLLRQAGKFPDTGNSESLAE